MTAENSMINNKPKRRPLDRAALVLALLFALIMICGFSIKTCGSLQLITGSAFLAVRCLFIFAGLVLLFYALLDRLYRGLETGAVAAAWRRLSGTGKQGFFTRGLDRRPFRFPFIVLLFAWLPYWIVYFPGNIMYDPFVQLDYFFGIRAWSDWHPVLISLLYGFLMQAGRALANDNLGLFFCIVPQYVLLAAALARCLAVLKGFGVSLQARRALLMFCAFLPFIPFYAISLMKDTLYYGLLLMFLADFLRLCLKGRQEKMQAPDLLRLFAIGMLISLARKNGIYVFAGSLLLLALKRTFTGRQKAALILGTVSVVMISGVLLAALSQAVGAAPAPVSEALSLPFQQTARTVKYHPESVAPEEREAIDRVLDYENLGTLYRPDLSDPVKSTFKGSAGLHGYFRVWARMFLRHPGDYVTATLCNTYSYYYLFGESTAKVLVWSFIEPRDAANTGFLDIHYAFPWSGLRKAMNGAVYFLNRVPFAGLLFHPGFYTWIMLISIGCCFRRGCPGAAAVYLPALFSFLVCLASPVNGSVRYFMPVILMLPFCLAVPGRQGEPEV